MSIKLEQNNVVFIFDTDPVVVIVDGVDYVPKVDKSEREKYVGKWVMVKYYGLEKWVEILSVSRREECFVVTKFNSEVGQEMEDDGQQCHVCFLDLTDARDHNPDEKKTIDTAHASIVTGID